MVWLETQYQLGMLTRVQENLDKYHGDFGYNPPSYFSDSRRHRFPQTFRVPVRSGLDGFLNRQEFKSSQQLALLDYSL